MSRGTRSLSASRNGQGATAGALSGLESGAWGTTAGGREASTRPAVAHGPRSEAAAVTPLSFPVVDATTAASTVRWGRAAGADGVTGRAGSADAKLKARGPEAEVAAGGVVSVLSS